MRGTGCTFIQTGVDGRKLLEGQASPLCRDVVEFQGPRAIRTSKSSDDPGQCECMMGVPTGLPIFSGCQVDVGTGSQWDGTIGVDDDFIRWTAGTSPL